MDAVAKVHHAVRHFLDEHVLVGPTDSPSPRGPMLMVGLSGGLDSSVLLHALKDCARQPIRLHAVHVHHGLRASADRDAQWAQNVCQALAVPCRVIRVHPRQRAERDGQGLEAAARQCRREAFRQEAARTGSADVVLAHHADDQVETMLWRWLRGSTLTGLAGIRPVSEWEGLRWLRPLLTLSRQDLLEYAEQTGLSWVEDESNQDPQYIRNYLRHHVIPLLTSKQARLPEIVAATADVLQEEDAYLHDLAVRLQQEVSRPDEEGIFIDVARFAASPVALQRRVIQLILYCLTSADWSQAHIESIRRLAVGTHPSASVDLPGSLWARRTYRGLFIGHRSQADSMPPVSWPLRAGGVLRLGEEPTTSWEFRCERWTVMEGVRLPNHYEVILPDIREVSIQAVTPGTRLRPLGMAGRKKVQDVFTDAKVPRHLRSRWPAVFIGDELIWLPGLLRGSTHLVGESDSTGWKIQAIPPQVW